MAYLGLICEFYPGQRLKISEHVLTYNNGKRFIRIYLLYGSRNGSLFFYLPMTNHTFSDLSHGFTVVRVQGLDYASTMSFTHDPPAAGKEDIGNDSILLAALIEQAIIRRQALIQRLHSEDTDAYRIFHGTAEGREGLTIDRYGPQVMVQTFHKPLAQGELQVIENCIKNSLGFNPFMVYHDRSSRQGSMETRMCCKNSQEAAECKELGIRYTIQASHRGQDPLLFLDLRAARRHVLSSSRDKTVLNLFAYTCGIGICAAIGGADQVINVDFSSSHLAFGMRNARLNGIPEHKISFITEDVFPVLRQFAGLPIKGRGGRREYIKFAPRKFDLVVIDPPRWAKSPFGAVDLVRDYQSIFKPALLTTNPGGEILCTNHVPQVALDDWIHVLTRCAAKAGRPLKKISIIKPEDDFPSKDDQHPLKIAILNV